MGNASTEDVFEWLREFGRALKSRRRERIWVGRDGLIHVVEVYPSTVALAELDMHLSALEAMVALDAKAGDDGD